MVMKISVVIPAFNEEQAIGEVVRAVPMGRIHDIVVVDNGSTDDTATQASLAGARVVFEPRPGYGAACLAGAPKTRAPQSTFGLCGCRLGSDSLHRLGYLRR